MLDKDIRIIEKILHYCNETQSLISEFKKNNKDYMNDSAFQLSTDMCIFQIGELSIHVSEELKKNNLQIPWAEMRGLRNVHAHEYDNVDRKKMWETLTKDIPDLAKKLEKLI